MKESKLSNRLLKIAEIVGTTNTILDIGTDHGYLPAYMIENNKVNHAIVSDISQGSLNKAIQLAKTRKLESQIEARKGSGFEVLNEDDNVDIAVIAGMGGNLIADILDARMDLIRKKNIHLILQPMQNPEVLRSYLLENQYVIINEHLVKEERFVYQIIEALPKNDSKRVDYSNLDLEFGRKTFYTDEELQLYHQILNSRKSKIEVIISRVANSETENKESIIKEYEEQIKLIEENL